MKTLLSALLITLLSGCASTKLVQVEASSPARIEVDGFAACDRTPCQVPIRCKDPMFFQPAMVTATPTEKGQYVQWKQVNACTIPAGAKMFFEMGLQPMPAKSAIDVNVR